MFGAVIVKQEWEAYWDKYRFPDQFMRSDGEPFNNPVRVMIAKLAEIGESVLDVGSASCISYPLFEDSTYVGMDFTHNFLKVAKQEHAGIVVVQGYALKLPFKDGAIDSVYIKDVFEHVGPDVYKSIIAEMWRVCKLQIILAFYGYLIDKTIYKRSWEPDEHNAGVPPYKGGTYYFNQYGRQDILDCVADLPDVAEHEIVDGVPLELSGFPCRTVVIVRKFKHATL